MGPSTHALGRMGTSKERGLRGSPRRSSIENVMVVVVATSAQAKKPQCKKLTAKAGSTAEGVMGTTPLNRGGGLMKCIRGSAADQNTPPPASRVQIKTAHQSKNLKLGFAVTPPSRTCPTGLIAIAKAVRKIRTTIHCQRPPRELLTMVLPVSVKCLAKARLMAETNRKTSSGIAPTQRAGWRKDERTGVGDSDNVGIGRDSGADGVALMAPAGNIGGWLFTARKAGEPIPKESV